MNRGGKQWNWGSKGTDLLGVHNEYASRHGCWKYLNEDKRESIYFNKRCTQSKAEQNPMCQSLQLHSPTCTFIHKWDTSYYQEKNIDLLQQKGL